MPLFTIAITVELEDDSEARLFHDDFAGRYAPGYAEVIESRWYRDLDAEAKAAAAWPQLVGVEWGGK